MTIIVVIKMKDSIKNKAIKKQSIKHEVLCGILNVLLLIVLLIGFAGIAYAEQISQEEMRQNLKISLIDYFKNPSKAALSADENRELLQVYYQSPVINGNLEVSNADRVVQIMDKIQSSGRYRKCIELNSPVCAIKDGGKITYSNKCKANLDGARVISKSECNDNCPQFAPTAPDWCKDGKIIQGGIDEGGCPLPPKCNPVNNSVLCSKDYDPVCGVVLGGSEETGALERRTFFNKCEAEKAGAVNIVPGNCIKSVDACQQKVRGNGVCDAYFEGYEFDNSAGKCVKKGASGCSL